MSKTDAHQRYRTKSGLIVPGVTTVLGILNKPALVRWANNLGLQGIDSSKYTDKMADIGTLAHHFVECHLKNEIPDTSEYNKEQVDLAENAFLKYLEWEKDKKIEVILSEAQLVSETWGFGGTIDFFGNINGVPTLIDFKTCKAIYSEQFTQVAAYKELLKENGHITQDVRILRIGRDNSEGFDDLKCCMLEKHWDRFYHCLEIYRINKELK